MYIYINNLPLGVKSFSDSFGTVWPNIYSSSFILLLPTIQQVPFFHCCCHFHGMGLTGRRGRIFRPLGSTFDDALWLGQLDKVCPPLPLPPTVSSLIVASLKQELCQVWNTAYIRTPWLCHLVRTAHVLLQLLKPIVWTFWNLIDRETQQEAAETFPLYVYLSVQWHWFFFPLACDFTRYMHVQRIYQNSRHGQNIKK